MKKKCQCEPCRRERRQTRRAVVGLACFLIALVAVLYFTGCSSTVTPPPVVASEASFGDDGKQNSGFIRFVEGGALIDAGARDRYNALVKLYGGEWLPEIEKDHGIRPLATAYFISNDALQKFLVMSDWKKMGRVPK